MNPNLSCMRIIEMLYPYQHMLKQENQTSFHHALETFGVEFEKSAASNAEIDYCRTSENSLVAEIGLICDAKSVKISVPCGKNLTKNVGQSLDSENDYVPVKSHEKMLSSMLATHSSLDFCLIGDRGIGKTALVKQFCKLLGYDFVTIELFADMTQRDLIQQRRMLLNGDTVWHHGPIVNCMKNGSLAILDGLHRLHSSTASSTLQRLIHDREIERLSKFQNDP